MPRVKVDVKWRRGVFRELRTLPEVQAELDERAARVADAAGDGYVVESGVTGGRGRGRSAVITGDYRAIRDNAKSHTLVRSLNAGQG